MPRIFGLSLVELLIIVAIICILFGPVLFKKINAQVKKTGKAAKSAVEGGAKAAGTEVDFNAITKDKVLDKVESLQDRVDKMFEDDSDEEAVATTAEPDSKKDAAEAQ